MTMKGEKHVDIETLKVMQKNSNEQLARLNQRLEDIDRKLELITSSLSSFATRDDLKEKAEKESVDNLWKFSAIIVVLIIFLLGFVSSLFLKNGGGLV